MIFRILKDFVKVTIVIFVVLISFVMSLFIAMWISVQIFGDNPFSVLLGVISYTAIVVGICLTVITNYHQH